MKLANLTTIIGVFVLGGLNLALADSQSFTRIFSYDPHPAQAEFAQPVAYNSENLKHQVVFHETWKSVKDKDYLQELEFTLQAVNNSGVVAEAKTGPFTIKKISKGQKIGEAKLGDNLMTVTIDEFEKSGAGVTDITLTFKLDTADTVDGKVTPQAGPTPVTTTSSRTVPLSEPSTAATKVPAFTKTAAGLYFCEKLVEKAATLPASQTAARLSLLKKALAAAPAAESSPDAAIFRDKVNAQISELENQKPATVAEPAAVEPVSSSAASEPQVIIPVTPPVIAGSSANKVSATSPSIPPAAVELYQSARSLFAQEKGPEGREALRKALEIAPDYQDALLLLGDNAYGNSKYSRAKEAYDCLISLNDRNADALLKYFKSCYYLGEGSDAVLRLTTIKDKYPTDNRIKIAVAEACFQLGDLVNAEALCSEVLSAAPDNSQAKDLLQRIRTHRK